MYKILILGASGSIGSQSIKVLKSLKSEYEIVGLSAGERVEIIEEFCKNSAKTNFFCVKNESDYIKLIHKYPNKTFYFGDKGLLELIENSNADVVLNALSGFSGFLPSLKTLELNKVLLLANKESLVVGGELINRLLLKGKGKMYPIDSEHVAIAKCLFKEEISNIDRIFITASGGPFFEVKKEDFIKVTPTEALAHPTWKMGKRISIDSASMMNKCFEIIEAHYLFNQPIEKIVPIVDRKSYVHSFIKFKDGRYKLQVGKPDMAEPIRYALNFGLPINNGELFNDVEVNTQNNYTFYNLDKDKFEAINYAEFVIKNKGNSGAILNAADEVAVESFLNGDINFIDITKIIDKILNIYPSIKNPTIDDLIRTDMEVRLLANKIIKNKKYE